MATMGNLNRPTTGMMGTMRLPSNRKPQVLPAERKPMPQLGGPAQQAVPLQPGMPATAPNDVPPVNRGISAMAPTDMMPADPISRPNGVSASMPPMAVDPARPPLSTDPAMRPAGNSGIVPPGNANGLYKQTQVMREGPPMPSMPNNPDTGRAASDGTTSGVAQPVALPPGMTLQQRPVSATGMPSQPPGPVGRPAGGLFNAMSRK